MNAFLPSLLISLSIYLILALSFFGWGKMLIKLFRIKDKFKITLTVWIGWAFLLVLLGIIHFFLPLKAIYVIPLFGIGIVPALLHLRKELSKGRLKPLLNLRTLLIGLPAGLFILWVTLHGMLQPTNYDSGLYYFNTIRWFNTYPIIKGLGNLHGRLAFNQSFFLYDAALNFFPWFNQGRSIANAFLTVLTLGTLLETLAPAIQSPKVLFKAHPFKYLPAILILPYLGYLALTSNGLGSPAPDLASSLLQIVLFIVLAGALGDWLGGNHDQTSTAFFIAMLTPTIITVKLSNLAYGFTIYLFALAYGITFMRDRQTRQALKLLLPLPILIFAVWIVRGYLLSGTPFFPSTFGYLPFHWSVPTEWIEGEANWIYSWARLPNVHPDEVLGNWNWLPFWWERVRIKQIEFIYPLFTGAGLLLLGSMMTPFRKQTKNALLEWSITLPVIASLVYWFFSAPDIRFNITIFPLLALAGALIVSTQWHHLKSKKLIWKILPNLVLVALISWFYFSFVYQNQGMVRKISISGYYDPPAAALTERITDSGLAVWVPDNGDQCWDSPLPCTPYFRSDLRLISPGQPETGFTVLPD